MKPLILLIALLFHSPWIKAQVFADFTVSQGGSPLGTFRARLDHDKAPRTCANFVGLASGRRPWINAATGSLVVNQPYYNGLLFHRLIHNFMIQGGSPNGQGTDGPGFVIQDEFHASLRHSGRYMLSMAKTSLPNTGGSQFFITLEAAPFLDDKHSVFGEVITGREIIDAFTSTSNFPTGPNDRPLTPITMDSVAISGPGLAGFDIDNPALMLPHASGIPLIPSRNSAANSFTLTFDRRSQHNYVHSYSLNLTSWTPFRQILSLDNQDQWPFEITGVTFDRFFSRVVDVDYSSLPNPPNPLLPAGASLTITDRAGNSLSLFPNGLGAGTWTDNTGGNGSILSLTTYDSVGNAGTLVNAASNAHFIPLARLVFKLDAGTGPNSRSEFNLVLSFHTANSGWTDGTGTGGPSPGTTTVLQRFDLTR